MYSRNRKTWSLGFCSHDPRTIESHLHRNVMSSETEDRLTASAALSHAWLLIGGTSRPHNISKLFQPEVAGAQLSSCVQGEGGADLGHLCQSVSVGTGFSGILSAENGRAAHLKSLKILLRDFKRLSSCSFLSCLCWLKPHEWDGREDVSNRMGQRLRSLKKSLGPFQGSPNTHITPRSGR